MKSKILLTAIGAALLLTAIALGIVEGVKEVRVRLEMPGYKSPRAIYNGDSAMARLCKAIVLGDLKGMERTVKEGKADVNKAGAEGVTPLLLALRIRNKAAFAKLLELGANPNQQDKWCPMAVATRLDDTDFLDMCLKHGGNPNLFDKELKDTLLGISVTFNKKNVLEILLAAGADPNLPTSGSFASVNDGIADSPVIDAVVLVKYDMAIFLLEHGASLQLKGKGNLLDRIKDNLASPYRFHAEETLLELERLLDYMERKGVDVKELRSLVAERRRKNAEAK